MPSLTLALLALGAHGHSPSPTMEDLVRRYSTDIASVSKYYSAPLSAHWLDRHEAFEKETLTSLKKVDFNELDRDGQVYWILLRNACDSELRGIATSRKKNEKTAVLL